VEAPCSRAKGLDASAIVRGCGRAAIDRFLKVEQSTNIVKKNLETVSLENAANAATARK
jgi:hypothetical protein